MPVPFSKPWLNYAAQVDILKSRGLLVPDQAAAQQFLSHVNYYRLSGYCLAFEGGARHTFVAGTTFEHVVAAYKFDFTLRDLLSEALEIVEVDVRTAVAHHFGQQYGAFGHVDPANFYQTPPHHSRGPQHGFRHSSWLDKLRAETKRSKELFVDHFKSNYDNYPDLPVWVATEIMSFGSLSKMCEGMVAADQRAVASRYGAQPSILESWFHHLSVVRNCCAHHARVWDRVWSLRPLLPPGRAWSRPYLGGNSRLAATLLILNFLLKRCPSVGTFPTEWRARVNALLLQLPAAPTAEAKLGITPAWASGPLWQ